jgi:hypothetical protein
MNSGLEGVCEEAFIIKFEVLSWYLVEGTGENPTEVIQSI